MPPISSHLPVNVTFWPSAPPSCRVEMPVSRINAISETSTRNPETLSIAPTATALADDRPIRPKKRISRAIRAAELGHRERDERDRPLQGEHRTEPDRPDTRADRAERLRDADDRHDRDRRDQPAELRRLELVDQVVDARRSRSPRSRPTRRGRSRRPSATEATVTRRSCSSFGTSTPATSAACARRSSSFHPASDSARRVGRVSAAGCRYGRTAAIASPPSSAWAAVHRSPVPHGQRGRHEQLRAVGLHGHGRRRHGGAAQLARGPASRRAGSRPRRRPAPRARSSRGTARRRAPRCAAVSRRRHRRGRAPTAAGRRRSRSRGSRHVPRRAPRSPPAAPRSPTRSARSVTNASCSTCWSRPPTRGVSPRFHTEDHSDVISCPSHASRP